MLRSPWENLSIRNKIFILVGTLLLFTLATGIGYHLLVGRVRDLAVDQTTAIMHQDYRNELKNLVDSTALSLGAAVKGLTDEQQIHSNFSTLVKPARFFADHSGYYFIYQSGGTVFVHPTLPELEGQNIINKLDQKGTPFIRKLDQVARAGGGFVEYWFDKPGQGILPKLSYARMIPGTDYWIGTGVYIDDVEKRQQQILGDIHLSTRQYLLWLYLVIGNAFMVLLVPLTFILARSISHPLRELTEVADRFSAGQLDLKVPGLSRGDEIGLLAQALDRLGNSMRLAIQRLQKKS